MKLLLICLSLVLVSVSALNRLCSKNIDYGDCHGFHMKWAYSHFQHKCQRFDYSGCGGNDNRFNSRSECERSCHEEHVPINLFRKYVDR